MTTYIHCISSYQFQVLQYSTIRGDRSLRRQEEFHQAMKTRKHHIMHYVQYILGCAGPRYFVVVITLAGFNKNGRDLLLSAIMARDLEDALEDEGTNATAAANNEAKITTASLTKS